jgi:hypothetical protein
MRPGSTSSVTGKSGGALLLEDRRKERQAGDVVVMEMAEQQVDPPGARAQQAHRPPGGLEAAAGIDDEDALSEADLDAAGMATVDDRVGSRHGDGTAGAPEAHRQLVVPAVPPLRHHGEATVAPSLELVSRRFLTCHGVGARSRCLRNPKRCASRSDGPAAGRQAEKRTPPRQEVADISTMLKVLALLRDDL